MGAIARANTAGVRTRDAILPSFDKWLNRTHGELSFHVTQFLTGHDCFATFLYRIGKLHTPVCQQCGEDNDSMEHTLCECPKWRDERNALSNVLGTEPELKSIIPAICDNKDAWDTFTKFCVTVLLQKENEERLRQQQQIDSD